jgi:hypothetical protein
MRRVCLLSVILFLFCFGPQVFAATLISDNFDSYTTGQLPGDGWITDNSGAIIVIDNETYHSLSHSAYVRRSSSGGYFYHTHTSITDQVTYEAYLRSTVNQRETLVMLAGGNGGSGPWVSFGGIAGYLAYYDGSWHNITTVNSNQWYHVKIVAFVSSHTFDIYVDDMNTPLITGANFRDGSSVTSLEYLSFNVFNSFNPPTTSDSAFVDDVLVTTPTTTSSSIPTMSKWGIIIFIVLAGLGAIYYLRRQRKAES